MIYHVIGVNAMQQKPLVEYASEISSVEIKIIEKVLSNYNLNVLSVEKVRSAYKVCTDTGIFCLKRVSHGYRKAKKAFYISEHLKNNGFDGVADYFAAKHNDLFIKYKDAAFYMTHWVEGREANFRLQEDVLRCAELLSEFHNRAKGFKKPKHVKVKSYYGKWIKHFDKYTAELEGFRDKIDRLPIKSEFDYMYRNYISSFANEARLATAILRQCNYDMLQEFQKNELYICHDSFYYQNVLIDKQNKMYIVDLESCCYNLPMSDLGKFLRRVLSKSKYKWDFDICRKIIESYCKIRPISKDEYILLLSMIVFPHKFWKLGRKRYVKNKKWVEEKYKKKLRKIVKYNDYKREFIKCFIAFYSLDIEYDAEVIES